MGPSRTQSSLVCCTICNQTFGRQEHLTRHVRIHTREKPYQCSLCEKRFSRLDVLNRHVASHEEESDKTTATASSRACRQCALDRVRCSRGQPCRRCMNRRLACRYPTTTLRAQMRMHNPVNGTQDVAILEQGVPYQLVETSDARPAHSESDNDGNGASTSFSSSMANAMSNPDDSLSWMGTMSAIDNAYDINHPDQLGLGVSEVNWMSPQYELAVDWDALLSGYAANTGMQQGMGNERGISMAEGGDQRTSMNHQYQQQIQTELQSEPPRSIVSSSISSNSTEGRYYVDGVGARAPFGGRSHNRDSIVGIEALPEYVSGNTASRESPGSPGHPESGLICSTMAYNKLVQTLVAEIQLQAFDIDNANLPSHGQMQRYVLQYFKKFHPIFPFLRQSSFADDAQSEPLLLLAVSVVGARYTRRLQGSESGEILFRLLNAMLRRRRYGYGFYCDDGNDDASFSPGLLIEPRLSPSLHMLQAGILNVACKMHSAKKCLIDSAFVERHYLVEACHSMKLTSRDYEDNIQWNAAKQNEHDFLSKWILREKEIRTGMMIWFLDSMFLYQFDAKPLMQLDDIKVTLPSHEEVWESPDLVQQGKKFFADVTLLGAMETIYTEKRLPPHLGEFSIGLLVNAIYRNTMQIMAREQIRLNSWTPTAIVQSPSHQVTMQQNLPPMTPTMSKWRNSACDCLDVLHWPANSKAAQLSGSEHHTILHLHLARLIILIPTTHIQTFATESISAHTKTLQSSKKYAMARQHVLQWVLRDRFKARLSIVHCGALYWHVRRYSCDSMLEPYAIYMATLVLWAFCVSNRLPDVVEAAALDNDDEPEPHFLHLDRPLDDELVQTFVRVGHKMSAHISKVGDIQNRGAPGKILQEGISLLARDSHMASSEESGLFPSSESPCYTWGIEGSFAKSLRDLLQATAAPSCH